VTDTDGRLGEPDPLRLAVGLAIHKARAEAGMSMRALAIASGLSQPFLSAVERGLSTPSIATLYRLAEVLGTTPAGLLPVHDPGDITVVRAGHGQLVPSSDHPDSALGRVIFSDRDRNIEIYEYVMSPDQDLEVWFEHPGDTVLHLIEGALRIDFESRPSEHLAAGDCMVHPGKIAHRWAIEGDEQVRLFLVIVRPPANGVT
jgi:transcriptional regulator with XRE-family HTH domain